MELDRVAQHIVLESVRQAVPSNWPAKVAELRTVSGGKDDVTLTRYLAESGLELTDVYAQGRSWSDLLEAADLPVAPAGPHEERLRKAIGRLLHIDDEQRIHGYQALLSSPTRPDPASMSRTEKRLLRMLLASVSGQILTKQNSLNDASLGTVVDLVWSHPQVIIELRELLSALHDAPNHVQHTAITDVPLQVHSRYTRIEMLAAVGDGDLAKTPDWREGVYDAKPANADLLAFTLDKTSGGFSPTTRYRDYAISPDLIHWESQSTTTADSPTGRRYQRHEEMGRSILLFARARQDDRAFWFLGPATYVRHEGELPMAVTWKLATPLSGDLFAAFAAAVA
jgi:hypothetical protein